MKNTYELLFALIKTQISKQSNSVNFENASFEEYKSLYTISHSHDLSHIVGKALLGAGAEMPEEIKKAFQKSVSIAMYRYMQLSRELATVCAALEDGKIPFIPLKGSVLRNYYDEPWMRTSCDIDVFVSDKDVDKAVTLLTEDYGYTFEERSSHDVSLYSESGVHVELHFDLIEGEKTRSILNNVWKYSKKADGFEYKYEMSAELFVTYHITHMAKHFINGGCGIKPLIDLWIIKNKMSYDEDKTKKMLQDIGLLDFYINAVSLSEVWFEDKKYSPILKDMEDYILQGGVYGTLEQQVAISQNKKGGKFKHLLSKIFISYDAMLIYYPSLKKCPILYPFYQVRRWFRIAFCGGFKRAMNEIKLNQNLSELKKEKAKRLIDELGL